MIPNGVLYPYNKSVAIYACPANTRQITYPANPPIPFMPTPGPQARTVSINYPLGGFTAADPTGSGVLLTGVRPVHKYGEIRPPNPGPSQMIVFVDENEYSVDDGDFAIDPAGSGRIKQMVESARQPPQQGHHLVLCRRPRRVLEMARNSRAHLYGILSASRQFR